MQFWNMTLTTLVAFVVTFMMVRLLGKKQVSTMTFWDLVSAIALGSLAANIIVNTDVPLFNSVWVVLLWAGLALFVGWSALQNRKFRDLVQGTPAVVVSNGKVLEEVMRRERLNMDLLLTELRAAGVFSLADVEFAVLEANGKISVLKKSQVQPVTPKNLGMDTTYVGLTNAVIQDGKVLRQNLSRLGLTEEWLMSRLAGQGIEDLAGVFYAELGTDGTLYVDRREDRVLDQWQPH
ncbi:MAG TPA: DUF421 domain-containing protein [Symbiobacteriaceae bacterium]|nr:DUF421 domain-containing protein [Symbiobacteriaceae bacterium]